MLEIDGVVGLILLAIWIYALFDAITTDSTVIRNLPKAFWILIILLLSTIGAILWFIAGRPQHASRPGGLPYKGNTGGLAPPRQQQPRHARGGSVAPDDDPEFLQRLKKSNDEHEGMLGSWEADLRRREEELRRGRQDGEKGDDPTT